jgi:catechol 2,3-dioxygenase-like lactoylglutathione lyase family enzyme
MTDRRTHVSTVHHVAFRVDDMDAALEFYMDVLGCKKLPRPEGLPGARGAWLQCGSTQVHLTELPADETTGRPPTCIVPTTTHVAFHIDDLDAAEASFRERGFTYLRGQFGVEQIFVQDPSGNLLELTPY